MRHTPFAFPDQEPGLIRTAPTAGRTVHVEAFDGFDFHDPRLALFLRSGAETASGAVVNTERALRNPAVFRAACLISSAIGMLPLHLLKEGPNGAEKASDHPLFRVLHREPNNWQTAYDFRMLMQLRALAKRKGAFAQVVRSRGNVIALNPLDPDRVEPFQRPDLSVAYKYRRPDGVDITLEPGDVFHLRGVSLDGINGLSLVDQAAEAIGLGLQAQRATARVYKNGSFNSAPLSTEKGLSDTAYNRLKEDWQDRYGGADNAGKTPILEEGLKPVNVGQSARDAQFIETQKHQIEEIARVFGVPRPLLMMDETSWGSGIEALGLFFVTYALQPWFTAWEQAIERTLLKGSEKDTYSAKFNAGALLRGSLKDQGEFFAKALGAGGQKPWLTQDEVRKLADQPTRGGAADELGTGAMDAGGGSDAEPA